MDIFSKQELQCLDFELEDMEKYHDIDEIKRRLKVNETFKKVISILIIDNDKDHQIPHYIKESPIIKNILMQIKNSDYMYDPLTGIMDFTKAK